MREGLLSFDFKNNCALLTFLDEKWQKTARNVCDKILQTLSYIGYHAETASEIQISDSNIKLNLAFLGTFPVQHCFWLCLDCYCLCFCCLFEEWCCSVITPCPEKSTDLFGIKAGIKPDPFSVTIITLLKHILSLVKEPMEADFC